MGCAYKEGVTALPGSLKDRVPAEYLESTEFIDAVAAAVGLPDITREQKGRAEKRAKDQFRRGRNPRTVKEQPRDYRGRFRDILARLKVNLGESELNEVVSKVEDAETAELNKDYGKSADAATDVIQMVDRLEEGALDPEQMKNIKDTGRELGKTIAFLPMPQGEGNAKLRFSDLPPSTQSLLANLKKRIEAKLQPDKARALLVRLESFTSGQVQMSSDEIQSIMAELLQYLID